MKLFRLTIIMVLTIQLFSCKKGDTDATPTNIKTSAIVGKWNYLRDSVNYFRNGVLVHSQVGKYTKGEIMQFNADGTGIDGTLIFTYTLTGDKLHMKYPKQKDREAEENMPKTLVLTSNKLTLLYGDPTDRKDTYYIFLSR
ncbi:hypothetical protein [Mucilaginibacter myungsuensis]|uniref:Lipocalin-like protein n=1 Tax=Mucilaginibacter myungsuensis TaxID=649104 RepID=A0A929L1F6_9SPHI|nr:hypothetical protein [Mucilaginibacter myungsuensis]MBE9661501.1 hypothetical protein [Mucilaginibacter myungsuensis]MDN3597644.1 hypothetical protein [Mucilaginibacter myungsuensis]